MTEKFLFTVNDQGEVFLVCNRGAFLNGVSFSRNEKLRFVWKDGEFELKATNKWRPGLKDPTGLKVSLEQLMSCIGFSFKECQNDWYLV